MRSVVLRTLAILGAGGLVLAGVLYVASTVDARPPVVSSISLTQPSTDDARVALITTSIEIVFSEPVETDEAAAAVSLEPEVDGAVSWSGTTMIFTPADPLELDTAYTLEVAAGIRDLAGNEMTDAPPPFAFQTSGRPTLVEANPADGADGVPLDQPIQLTFSTLMDTASVEQALRLTPSFPHELRWDQALLEIVPTDPLLAGRAYRITIQGDAADIAGVALEAAITVGFETVATGLDADLLVPADGIDGISPSTPIAVRFDHPIDADSVGGDTVIVTPAVAGRLAVVTAPGDPPADDGSGRMLVFTPTGPLPPNTTFTVEVSGDLTGVGGGSIGEAITWSFTTGAPLGAVSNQITFISDRAGIPNVWAMNPDGTGKRQLSAELAPILDYAVAPDGSMLALGDGSRLVVQQSDGSGRRVLTDDGVLDFDPAFSPDGQRIAFARADGESGAGLGLWQWTIGAGDPVPIELPEEPDGEPLPSASGLEPSSPLRAPRFAPDGQALAFVDLTGSIGILELPDARLTRVPFAASAPPIWMFDATRVLLTGRPAEEPISGPSFEAPVAPLAAGSGDSAYQLARSGTTTTPTPWGAGSHPLAASPDGDIAYVDLGGALWITARPSAAGEEPIAADLDPLAAAFAPGEPAIVVASGQSGARRAIVRIETDSGRRTQLAPEGDAPRWLP
jgi:hypothetical protein